jgi:putative FmdB family regulatory protein
MPIYEYKCSDCGHLMDALQGVNDAPLTDCPACPGKNLKRLISAPNFRLSGKGWYETDFKTGSKKNIVDTKDEKQSQPKEKTIKTAKSKEKSPNKEN